MRYERRPVAIGVSYRPTENPKVIRRGIEGSAREILREARRYGIPVVEDSTLAETLSATELDGEIPEDCFLPLAETFVRYRIIR